MSTIIKKISSEWFEAILAGKKDYELRLADFEIQEGDILKLEEWTEGEKRKATGRTIEKQVKHIRKVNLKDWINQQPELLEQGFYVIRF